MQKHEMSSNRSCPGSSCYRMFAHRSLSLSSPNVIPPSPEAIRNPGLVDVVLRVNGRSRIAPQNGVAAAGRQGTNQTTRSGGTLARTVWAHPGDVRFFFQDQCQPTILYPIALQWSDWTERALITTVCAYIQITDLKAFAIAEHFLSLPSQNT